MAIAGLAVFLLLGFGKLAGIGSHPNELVRIADFLPLVAGEALELRPALSPEGHKLTYLRKFRGRPAQLVLKDLRQESTSVLDDSVLDATTARWSPDGTRIAYFAPSKDGIVLRIRTTGPGVMEPLGLTGVERQSEQMNALLLDWLDVHTIVFSDRTAKGGFRLAGVDLQNGRRTNLTNPPRGAAGDVQPAVQNGLLAFARYTSQSEADIYVKDLQSGVERRLTNDNARIDGIAWYGSTLIVASMRSRHAVSLYRIQMDGAVTKLTTGETFLQFPQVAGEELVVQRHIRDANVWMRDGEVRPVSPSTAYEGSPAIRPDGSEIAFVSKRSGPTEIWVAGVADYEPEQLTHLGQTFTDCPRWSPDGKMLAFTSHRDGNRDIYVVHRETRAVHRITGAPSEEGRPSWSRDGAMLYYRSDRSGSAQIWRQGLGGNPVQLTRNGGYEGFESIDRRRFYFLKSRDSDELWSIPVDSGPERLERRGIRESRWCVTLGGILFLQDTTVRRWIPGVRSVDEVFQISQPIRMEAGFSSDLFANRLAWAQVDKVESDILHTRFIRE